MRLDGKLNRTQRKPQRTCAKKKSYKTSWDAVMMAFKYRMNGAKLQSPYECPWCKSIHLTSHVKLIGKVR